MAWSKEERAEYMKKWREENKDNVKKYRHQYYIKSVLNGKYIPPSKEYSREYMKKWRKANKEKYLGYQKKYQAKIRQIGC